VADRDAMLRGAAHHAVLDFAPAAAAGSARGNGAEPGQRLSPSNVGSQGG
jgi:hypothetical protein